MNIMRLIAAVIFFGTCTSSVYAADIGGTMSGGGGGDGVVAEFTSMANVVFAALRSSPGQSAVVDVRKISESLSSLNIVSTDEPLVVNNLNKDAKNWPVEGRIAINRARWAALSNDQRQILVVHEVISANGYDDRYYNISSDLLALLQKTSGTFMDSRRGVYIVGDGYSLLPSSDEGSCAASCNADTKCFASVYYYHMQKCRLNTAMGDGRLVGRTDAVTAIKTIGFRSGWEYMGADYRTFATNDPYVCSQQCVKESQCAAFTWQDRTNTCFLKSEVGGKKWELLSVSGVK
ncbi:PAN domain-containing protein [Bdellovibrio sp. HCB290]|uniref:PAN domain-containing protein n=1 Tax=Bdellovibrio sp. HCB290 TaxID=3394356 RepID=UPI0039B62AEB